MELNADQQQELLKIQIRNNVASQRNWPHKWSWMMDEYKIMNDKLATIEERSHVLQRKIKTDFRTICPIPKQTNHIYGWLADKPEFNMEVYGPDILTPQKIQEFCTLG